MAGQRVGEPGQLRPRHRDVALVVRLHPEAIAVDEAERAHAVPLHLVGPPVAEREVAVGGLHRDEGARQRNGPHACEATAVADVRVEAWRVHDTGLVAVPSRFRRLGGLVRHLQGQASAWPDTSRCRSSAGELQVTGGRRAGRRLAGGGRQREPRVPTVRRCRSCSRSRAPSHLLAAAAGAATEAAPRAGS